MNGSNLTSRGLFSEVASSFLSWSRLGSWGLILLTGILFMTGAGMENAQASGSSLAPGEYAEFDTSMGKITCLLLKQSAPHAVENFVGLATGKKEFLDPQSREMVKRNFYDGLIFHRVIKNFMIQGGDPLGNGMGGPGYQFNDEIDPTRDFTKKGVLAMANAGPNTNGSQFFITVAPAPWLAGNYTIFGEVVSGQDVADAISLVPTDRRDRPVTPVVINHVRIFTVVP
jgi:peptidyl-prolyl cis-trans isomerase A (cyclophilin A)